MDLDPFDYSDGGIAIRTLARMYAAPDRRESALDLLWEETRERALFLLHRVVCRLNATDVKARLDALEAGARTAGWGTTDSAPDDLIETMLAAFLTALGFEPKAGRSWTFRDLIGSGAAPDALLAYDVVVADMRLSRLAGTGRGGAVFSPLEDATRRFSAILVAGGYLSPAVNDGQPVSIGTGFGRPQLLAARRYVDACLAAA